MKMRGVASQKRTVLVCGQGEEGRGPRWGSGCSRLAASPSIRPQGGFDSRARVLPPPAPPWAAPQGWLLLCLSQGQPGRPPRAPCQLLPFPAKQSAKTVKKKKNRYEGD